MPKISIIIPVYNASKYLQECLDSILSQTFSDWECILVDDGSTDGSGELCDKYADRDNRFVVLHQRNSGVSSARNAGIERVNGDYLCFVDADDILLSNALEVLYSTAVTQKADIVCANAWRWKGDEKKLIITEVERTVKGDVLPEIVHFALWAQLFNMEVIRKNYLWFIEGLAYSEDAVFVSSFAISASSMCYINEPVYIYRINEESACRTIDSERMVHHQFWAAHEFLQMREKNADLSERAISFLENQEHRRIKWGITAFLESNRRYDICYQFREYRDLVGYSASQLLFLRLYIYCLYNYYKMLILERIRI